jgi:AraC family transcriptional regulator
MVTELKAAGTLQTDDGRAQGFHSTTGCRAYDSIAFADQPRALARPVPDSDAWLVRHYGLPGTGDGLVAIPPLESHLLHLSLTGGCRLEARADGVLHRVQIRHGDLALVPAGTDCRLLPPRSAAAAILVIPVPDLDRALAGTGGSIGQTRFGLAFPRVASLLLALDRDLHGDGPGARLIYEALLLALGDSLASDCPTGLERMVITPLRLKRVTDFVMANLDRDIGLNDMARVAALSPFHFARVFRVATGLSPYRFLLERRMAHACQLLSDPGIPIVEIAHRCGYAGQAHFTTAFQQRIGMPPGRYRKALHR